MFLRSSPLSDQGPVRGDPGRPFDIPSEQALLRLVTETARIGLVVLGPDRRYLYANSTYAEILDLPATELIGKRVEEVLPGVYEAQIRPRLDRAFAGERIEYDLRMAKAGEDRVYEVRYSPELSRGVVTRVVVVIMDTTDRERTQKASDTYAALVESSDDAIIGKDLDGTITAWNPGAERIFGYSAAEMVGSSIMRLIPEDRRDEEDRILALLRRGERVAPFDTLRRTKGGATIAVSVTTSPIRDAAGRVVGASKVARDITPRKRAEEAQRLQSAILQTERELTLDGILVVDAEGKVLSYNRRFAEMWGIPPETLAARKDQSLLTAVLDRVKDPAAFLDRVRTLYERHDEASEDEVALTDGRVFDRYSAPMRDEEGRYYGRVWYFRDITERRQVIEALRAAEERMRFALQNAGIGIWEMDFGTGKFRVSEILDAQYGRAPGAFAGTFEAFIAAVHPDDRTTVVERIAHAARTGSDFTVVHRAIRPDGTVRWITSAGRVHRGADGVPTRGLGISMDITERKSLEDQYAQAQKMEAVGRLAGGVAHDFNNLLTAILGYCQLILADLDPHDPLRADVEEIHKAGASAAALTRQLLAFSRKQIIAPILLDLNAVTGALRGLLTRLIGEDVEIELHLNATRPTVLADVGQLEQVVMNLAVNARDAMPQGGILTIETENVDLDETYGETHLGAVPGPYVALTVSDTGVGMTPEVQARLFEPFFTTEEIGKGTGLGLATVHGIVSRSRGTIRVYSEVGQGTAFTVYLPRAGEGVVAPDGPHAVAPERAVDVVVLVVEDSDGIRELTRRMLERQGYTVLLAADAGQALEIFDRTPRIDVILTDVVMPGASGPELVRQLAARRPGMKVVYMSGYTEEAITHHGVLDPGIAFVHKPFTADTLGQKLREVLGQ